MPEVAKALSNLAAKLRLAPLAECKRLPLELRNTTSCATMTEAT